MFEIEELLPQLRHYFCLLAELKRQVADYFREVFG